MFRSALAAVAALFTRDQDHGPVTARPEVMTGAFEAGFVGEADKDRHPLRTVRLGELDLASGRLILADPFFLIGPYEPLDLAIAPGRYPVDLAVADTGTGGHRVALARLVLSEAPPARWEMARVAGEDPARLKSGDVFGFPVDSGTAAFVDAGSMAWLTAATPEENIARFEDWQARGEARAEALGLPHGLALVEAVGPGGVAMFSSGWGDGHYASWVGYDADGAPAAVVTDFAVITAVNIPGP